MFPNGIPKNVFPVAECQGMDGKRFGIQRELTHGAFAILNWELQSSNCGPHGRHLREIDGSLGRMFIKATEV